MDKMNKQASQYGMKWIFAKTKGERLPIVFYAILVIIGTVLAVSVSFFMKAIVDIATGDSGEQLWVMGLLAVSVIFASGIFTVAGSVLAKYIEGKMERSLRTELMGVIFSRNMLDISKEHSGELMTKLTIDVQAVSSCFNIIINKLMGGIVSSIIAAVSIFVLDWKMAIVLLVLLPLLMLATGRLMPHMRKASETDKCNDEKNRVVMQEYLSRIMLVKTYFMQNKINAKMYNAYAPKLKSGMKLGMWEGLVAFSATVSSWAIFIVVLGVGAFFVLRGEATIGSLLAIVQLLNFIVMPISGFSEAISNVGQSLASSGRIGEIIDLPADKITAAAEPIAVTELVAEDIGFAYEKNEGAPKTLKRVNAAFPKGTVTGIVGKSGCGKSTLLKLLIGVYSPDDGEIKLKHTSDGETMKGGEIITQVAYVPPSEYLFSGSVAENIIMSESEPRAADLRDAAADANILDFVESQPDGFNTIVGESGGTVSSGQAQRIAIARAIYKKAGIVVFDEPTANLDADSIKKFQSIVRKLAEDRICIIVTHDTSTVSVCDRVYVLEDGCVKEQRSG